MKRWGDMIFAALLAGLLAWLTNPLVGGEGLTWAALTEPRVIVPGLVALLTTLYAYYQPSTKEGAESARK